MVRKQGGTIYAQFEQLSSFVSGNDTAFIPDSMGASKEFVDTGYSLLAHSGTDMFLSDFSDVE